MKRNPRNITHFHDGWKHFQMNHQLVDQITILNAVFRHIYARLSAFSESLKQSSWWHIVLTVLKKVFSYVVQFVTVQFELFLYINK